ncbi:hypothetical protein J6590_005943 [Homalodisca vitripennis]|nr:hypothetical protein J6590_005943 [Homalodisca vitripennis]
MVRCLCLTAQGYDNVQQCIDVSDSVDIPKYKATEGAALFVREQSAVDHNGDRVYRQGPHPQIFTAPPPLVIHFPSCPFSSVEDSWRTTLPWSVEREKKILSGIKALLTVNTLTAADTSLRGIIGRVIGLTQHRAAMKQGSLGTTLLPLDFFLRVHMKDELYTDRDVSVEDMCKTSMDIVCICHSLYHISTSRN